MSDPDHPNPNPSPPPVAAEEPDLQDQVDELLDEVDALTKETLGESESGEARAPADVPTTDPAREIAVDDVGLSSESPLVQDGEGTSVEEVAADVDQELDQMERLISGIGGLTSPADSGTSDPAEVAAAAPAKAPNPQPPTEPDTLIAGQIPSDPQSLQPAESAKETTLDHDIDALLASPEVADLEAPMADVSPPADLGGTPATTDRAAPKPGAAPQSDIDLESIPIWRMVKLKLKAKSRQLGLFIGRRAADVLVWLLDRIDAKIGNKLSPMAREMVGYCALATLAMSIIALIIFLL